MKMPDFVLQLTQRPNKLHLLPDEKYPTTRPLDEPIKEEPLVIEDMPQMANFVYKLYVKKIEEMQAENPAPVGHQMPYRNRVLEFNEKMLLLS